MTATPRAGWKELCALATVETDGHKLLRLVREINRLMDSKDTGQDFTLLPIGFKIDNGEIQVCPFCERRGKLEIVDGKDWYIHSHVLSAGANLPAVACDMCPRAVPTPPKPLLHI